jgi:hypothetical protein
VLDGLRQCVLVPDPTRGAVLVVRGAGHDELRLLAAAAAPVAHAHHALSYLGILEALEDADRWWFVDEPRRWLLGAIERVEAMRGERPI